MSNMMLELVSLKSLSTASVKYCAQQYIDLGLVSYGYLGGRSVV